MRLSLTRTLVLMLCNCESDHPIFAGDLYSGSSIVDSVYLDRAALLRWLATLDAEAGKAAARAMDELLTAQDHALRSVPVRANISMPPVQGSPASLASAHV